MTGFQDGLHSLHSTNGPLLPESFSGAHKVQSSQNQLASFWWPAEIQHSSPFLLDLKNLWFGSNLSELTYPLVTTRGIPFNVIKAMINVEQSVLSQHTLTYKARG